MVEPQFFCGFPKLSLTIRTHAIYLDSLPLMTYCNNVWDNDFEPHVWLPGSRSRIMELTRIRIWIPRLQEQSGSGSDSKKSEFDLIKFTFNYYYFIITLVNKYWRKSLILRDFRFECSGWIWKPTPWWNRIRIRPFGKTGSGSTNLIVDGRTMRKWIKITRTN